MTTLLRDEAVIVAVVVALVLVGVRLLLLRTAFQFPAVVIWLAAAGVGLSFTKFSSDRYVSNSLGDYEVWLVVVVLVGAGSLLALMLRHHGDVSARSDLTIALVACACALFLFIPETNVLRVVTAPLVIVGCAVFFDRLSPFGATASVVTLVVLVWISVADGVARPRTMAATAAVLSLASLLVSASRQRENDDAGSSVGAKMAERVATSLLIIIVGRVLGTSSSDIAAAIAALIVGFAAVAAVITGNTGNDRGLRASRKQN